MMRHESKTIAIVGIALLLSACTPQKRLIRLCKKHPEICEQRTDTINVIKFYPQRDTTYTIHNIDTTIHITQRGDSIIITNNYYKHTLQVSEKLKTDTLQQVITKTEIKKDLALIEKYNQLSRQYLILLIVIGLIAVALLGRFINKVLHKRTRL